MTVDKAFLASMRAEARKHRKIADELDATVANLSALDGSIDPAPAAAPAAKEKASTGRGRGGKKTAAKPKPAAKKGGERKARVSLDKVKEIVQGFLFEQGEQGATINDVLAFEDSVNRAAVTRAIKDLADAGVVTDDGNKRNTRYFAGSAPVVADTEHEDDSTDETTEVEPEEESGDEEEEAIDPTLEEDESPSPAINFGS